MTTDKTLAPLAWLNDENTQFMPPHIQLHYDTIRRALASPPPDPQALILSLNAMKLPRGQELDSYGPYDCPERFALGWNRAIEVAVTLLSDIARPR